MNLTRERIRQVEVKALAKLEALKDMASLRDYIDEGPVGKRRLPVIRRPPRSTRTRTSSRTTASDAADDADVEDVVAGRFRRRRVSFAAISEPTSAREATADRPRARGRAPSPSPRRG